MPVSLGHDSEGCFARWGHKGHKYHYTCGDVRSRAEAEKKAIAQGVAIGDFEAMKISFDYDGTISLKKWQEKAKELIIKGNTLYIISARSDKDGMLDVAREVGIPDNRVYATGSNKVKIEKILELNIDKHYDNNSDVINQLGSKGIKV